MPGSSTAERRRSPRRQVTAPVIVSTGPADASPPGEIVDLSADGTLIRLDAEGTLPARADRVVLSIDLVDGVLHLLGHTCRNLRGDDGRWYVAVEFDEVEPMDRTRLDRLLASAAASDPDTRPDATSAAGGVLPLAPRRDAPGEGPAASLDGQRSFSNVVPSAASASIRAAS